MKLSDSNLSALSDYFRSRQTEILSLVKALVETESPSGDRAGSEAVVSLLSETASSISQFTTNERITSENYGEHLRLVAFAESAEKPIVILGHTDTVHPRGSLLERPWRIEAGHAYGSGVFDMKANCALAVELVRACAVTGLTPRRPIVLLLTCDEETGSRHSRKLIEAAARNAHAVLVLEPPGIGGRAKTGRKGTGIFTIEARGHAAHAGLEPEKGASAVLELARQTDRLHSLNGAGGGISVNVGVFHGGTLSNVVPDHAKVEVDVRFSSADEAAHLEKEINNLHAFDERVQLLVTGGINRPPLERSEKVAGLYGEAKVIAERLGFELGEIQVGGASDGNFAAAAGAAVLDGLGINGDGAHAAHEHITIEDIPRRGALLAGLILTL